MVMTTEQAPRQRERVKWIEVDLACVVNTTENEVVNAKVGERFKVRENDANYLQNANRAHIVEGPLRSKGK